MSIRVLHNGELDPRCRNDPRWSDSQREAVEKAAAADPDARLIGMDARMRPVVTCELVKGERSQYAVLRNGAPANPEKPFAEVWNHRPRRRRTSTNRSTS